MGLAKHILARVATSAALTAIPTNVYAILLFAGTANTTVKLTDDATGSGTAVLNVSAPANGPSVYMDFTNLGPVMFTSKCYVTVAGTAGEVFIWYDA